MPFSYSFTEKFNRAKADLRIGGIVILHDDKHAIAVAAAETISKDRFNLLRAKYPEMKLGISHWRAKSLNMPVYDDDLARINIPKDTRFQWIRDIANPIDDLSSNMHGPFDFIRDGNANLMRGAIKLSKSAHLMPIILAVDIDLKDLSNLETTHLHIDQLNQAFAPHSLENIVSANVPIHSDVPSRLRVFRQTDGGEEHLALIFGDIDTDKPVLTRLHSACVTGDILGSLKCDCGPQLKGAMQAMAKEGTGVLIYLNQEGRGIGITNKIRAYALQDQGYDTVEANHRLGFEDDERHFNLGAQILREIGVDKIKLLTNNPRKVARLEKEGITVTKRIPLVHGKNPLNADYLATKAKKSGHLL